MIEIRTASGRRIDLEHPNPDDFVVEDIARGLSHACRFAGQLDRFYSVAQHSVLVASLVDPPMFRLGLLHDASEAYLGDLSRNLKHHPLLEGYRTIEARVQGAIAQRFLFHDTIQIPGVKEKIKAADDLAACFEREVFRGEGWQGRTSVEVLHANGYVKSNLMEMLRIVHRLPGEYHAWSSFEAHEQFLHRHTAYWERIKDELLGRR